MCRVGVVNAVTAEADKLIARTAAASAYRFFDDVLGEFAFVILCLVCFAFFITFVKY